MNDEIEIDGIKYVRKRVQIIYEAFSSSPSSESVTKYKYRCGAPDCECYASSDNLVRNTELVRGDEDDELFFTCTKGHRNKLFI